MIKTLRITSVAAVLLAVVVLASVLGYLRPDSLSHLNFGVRSDKQIEKILTGPSAVDRFKEQHGNKVPSGEDTTPPLVKQAELFADIINPSAPTGLPGGMPNGQPPRPSFVKPSVPVAGKFELLGTCYSDTPGTSFAYIRLPDGTCQWAGVGTEIGRVTIKEVRKGSIVCWDGGRDVEMNTVATPETSSLLETGRAPKDAANQSQASSEPPALGRAADFKLPAPTSAPVHPVRPSVASNRGVAFGVPPAQISKEEQENLTELGNRLKTGEDTDTNPEVSRLISDFKSAQANPSQAMSVPNPVAPADANKGAWKENMKEDTRRQWQRRLTMPRATKK
ncbi:MAG: hypothetical protein NTZ17_19560 [Phycisphaerae bacterium]|nr:hypothetical protein [Phycisphaerae bacterium]